MSCPNIWNQNQWYIFYFALSVLSKQPGVTATVTNMYSWQKQRSKSIHPTLIGMSPNGHADNASNCQKGQITASKKLMIFWWRPMCIVHAIITKVTAPFWLLTYLFCFVVADNDVSKMLMFSTKELVVRAVLHGKNFLKVHVSNSFFF